MCAVLSLGHGVRSGGSSLTTSDGHVSGFRWDDTYPTCFPSLAIRTQPVPVSDPTCVFLNVPLATEMGLPSDPSVWAKWGSGQQLPPGSTPWAMAYAGHQFGQFTVLGDGRAVVLGEHLAPDHRRVDIQLKGSGVTPFSRRGDGKAALGPMLREALISEAMHGLGIPTTRTLAVVATGETVWRGEPLAGAVLTRLATSHIRVGTFQYVAHQGDPFLLRALWDYTCGRHGMVPGDDTKGRLDAFSEMVARQVSLVMAWLRVGFIHGVMNTDNMALSGETIDYGPCALMDGYDPLAVYSAIDHQGRYAFMRQPECVQWNMARLAEAVWPLFNSDVSVAMGMLNDRLQSAHVLAHRAWMDMMRQKLGWVGECADDASRIDALLAMMAKYRWDYTQTFYYLTNGVSDPWMAVPEGRSWWEAHCHRQGMGDPLRCRAMMKLANPVLIPRNHLVATVLASAEWGSMTDFMRYHEALKTPYVDAPHLAPYRRPPDPHEVITTTFCGT